MSELLPLFPLPTAVLFPNVFLPLHIFEPRYRQMVADALAGDRLIGMVLLRAGWQEEYEGRPAIYPIGCSGVITHVETLPDGCYNLVLRGLDRFRVVSEDDTRPYRRAEVELLGDAIVAASHRPRLHDHRLRLEALIAQDAERAASHAAVTAAMPDEDLVNALAQYLDFEPIEKQALLELDGPLLRAEALIELLAKRREGRLI
jgi:Lon protease-like protein